MAGSIVSPSKNKQPLAKRSVNIPSPVKSPSKIALPPSPASSPTEITKRQSPHIRSFSQDMMEPVIENPMSTNVINQKPDLVRRIADAHTHGQTYVSPSDDIFSPTTQKLNEVKAKRFGNKAAKRTNPSNHVRMLFKAPSSGANENDVFKRT